MKQDNIVIRRGQIGQAASILGGVGLLVGVLGLIWSGSATPFVLGALAVGGLGVVLWALVSPAEFRGFVTGRQMRHSTASVFATLLLIGIVALAYVFAQRSVLTLDMTLNSRYTLSPESIEVLRRIPQPIQITAFYSPRGVTLRDIDDQYWRQYEVESNGQVQRRYIDPDREPGLRNRFQVTREGEVFVSFLLPDGTVDFNTVQPVPRETNQERDMTQAIQRLLLTGTVTVYFEVSSGTLDPADSTAQGISGINDGIRRNGIITQPLDLLALAQTGGRIPQDAATLIFARPRTDLSQAEIVIIDEYVNRGGSLFLMADAVFLENAFLHEDGVFNQYLWTKFGLRMLDVVVVDESQAVRTGLDIRSAAIFTENPIASRLNTADGAVYFDTARAVEVSETPPTDTPNGRIVMSSPSSFGERDLEQLSATNSYTYDPQIDMPGPLTMAAWATNRITNAKILLVGDGDFVTNGQVSTGGNSILFTDGLSWLSGYGSQVEFAPQFFTAGTPLIFVSGEQLDFIAFLTVFLIPGLVLVIGLAIWLRRARA